MYAFIYRDTCTCTGSYLCEAITEYDIYMYYYSKSFCKIYSYCLKQGCFNCLVSGLLLVYIAFSISLFCYLIVTFLY